MPTTRRRFLQTSAAYAAGFAGLRSLIHPTIASAAATLPGVKTGFGELVADTAGVLDLPAGFSYRVISRTGDKMDDGLLVSSAPDGMGAFEGPDGLTLLVRNHEIKPGDDGPFGKSNALPNNVPCDRLYDDGDGVTPAIGGTTTVVFDTKKQEVVRQFQSLTGTERNCAGGPTPWGSWITCEETVDKPGCLYDPNDPFTVAREHGYCFEVPATDQPGLADPIPLVAMGRMRHEAIAVHKPSGAIFETEDVDDSCLYRFLPNVPGDLAAGGKLQALAIKGRPTLDTRNWDGSLVTLEDRLEVEWIDLDNPESPEDDLRYRGQAAGAARFARGEGIWFIEGDADTPGEVYIACTSGGSARLGQIWKYTPSPVEGSAGEASQPGTLELFLEPNDSRLVENADNLTAAPWGDLVVCEDRQGDDVRLVGVTPEGQCYTLARNHVHGEFAGVTFSPDGSTLFVNLQTAGMTLAITGPWLG